MTDSDSNGQVTLNGVDDPERIHYCRNCGHRLCATTVPLGTRGIVVLMCQERQCGRLNHIKIGDPPLPRPDRGSWILEMQRRRQRATSF